MSTPPSGTQYEIICKVQRATVVEVGAALREYDIDGLRVLDGFSSDERAEGGRGQPLLPWPNRILDGQYEFDGESHQLPIDEVIRNNAIHGLTRWQNWKLLEHAASRVRLGLTVHPRPGYPFFLVLEIVYSLDDHGLRVQTTARNGGSRPLPLGAGQHPYLTVGTRRVDEACLQFAAGSRLEMDPVRQVPTGVLLSTAATARDFRTARKIGKDILDECFTDLSRDEQGKAYITLSNPASGRSATVWMSRAYRYIQVFSGDTLGSDKRRRSLAIEPMTCPPNAFRTGVDLIVLHPGEEVRLEWGITTLRIEESHGRQTS
jgi:aldose 1-epimerase